MLSTVVWNLQEENETRTLINHTGTILGTAPITRFVSVIILRYYSSMEMLIRWREWLLNRIACSRQYDRTSCLAQMFHSDENTVIA